MTSSTNNKSKKFAIEYISYFLLYLFLAFISEYFAFNPTNIIPFWLPGGLFLAMLLLKDYKHWGYIILISFLANMYFDISIGRSILLSSQIFVFKTIVALGISYIIRRRFNHLELFTSTKSALWFVITVVIVNALVSVFGIWMLLGRLFRIKHFYESFYTLWSGYSLGMLIIAPLVISLFQKTKYNTSQKNVLIKTLLAVAPALLLFFAALLYKSDIVHYEVYLLMPYFIWLANNYSKRIVFIITVMLTITVLWISLNGYGYYDIGTVKLFTHLTVLQIYLIISVSSLIVVIGYNEEKKKVTVKLQSADILFNKFFKTSPDGVIVTDKNGLVEYASDKACTILNESKNNITGKYLIDFITPQNRFKAIRYFVSLTKKSIDEGADFEFFKESIGIKKFIRISGQVLVEDSSNQIEAVFLILHDVTEKKVFEERILEIDQRIDFLTNNFDGGVILINKQFEIVYLSINAKKMFGFVDDNNLNQVSIFDILDFNNEEITDSKFKSETTVIKTGKRRNGETFKVEAVMKIFQNNRDVFGELIIKEITKTETVNTFSLKSLNNYKVLLKQLPEYVVIYQNDKIVFVNDAVKEFLQYSESDVLGKFILEMIPEEYHRLVMENKDTRSNLGDSALNDYEIEVFSKNGSRRRVIVRAASITYNNAPAVMVVLIDITERKKIETNLIKANNDLQLTMNLLAQKTIELEDANKKLLASEVALIENNANKDKFISILSHDLKGPFAGFLGITDLLSTNADSLPADEFNVMIQELNKALKNQYDLLSDLLTWSRVQNGKMKVNKTKIIAKNEIIKIIDNLKPNAYKKKISLTVTVEDNISVNADQLLFNLLLRNLISNAIKFTPRFGFISITGKMEEDSIRFSVTDNGIGMSDDTQNKLFKLESQFTTDGTESEEGTGLGLILCKEIMEKHNGRIVVESKFGYGSTFSVYFPK